MVRETAELSQVELGKRAGISQAAISAIEHGKEPLGLARAQKLARALRVHPAVLVFPEQRKRGAK
jgi:transcriptional regulator with XRE-family HTH domain